MIRAGDDPSCEPFAEQVQPGDPVAAARAVEDRERLVERLEAIGVDRDQSAVDPLQRNPSPDDHAGQPHAADRRVEELAVLLGGQHEHVAGGGQQADFEHLRSKRPRGAVVLAMHVCGDRPADRHVLGPGHDRERPAGRRQGAQQLAERRAGLGRQHSLLAVELERSQSRHVEHRPEPKLGGIAIAAPHPARDQALAGGLGDHVSQLAGAPRCDERHRRAGPAAPARECGVHCPDLSHGDSARCGEISRRH